MKAILVAALTVILALAFLRPGRACILLRGQVAAAERLAAVCELDARNYFGLNF